MKQHAMDPAPRSYAPNVYLMDRSARGSACAPEIQTLDDVKYWLLHEAVQIDDVMLMFEEFLWRCQAAGLDIDRSTLHIGTLHPKVIGFSWVWNINDGLCDEVAADMGASAQDAFTRNPLYRVMEFGEFIKVNLESETERSEYPLMEELFEEGFTNYVGLPLRSTVEKQNAMTLATKRPGGFTETHKEQIRTLIELFALHVERHILQRIARNVADTYLGPMAGRRVLEGEIKRGDGEAINAVVLMADMRGFTELTDRLSGPEVTALLNAYFDRISTSVIGHGGDILKFMGDGILAVFDQKIFGETGAADAAVKAAQSSLAAIEALNDAPPDTLPDQSYWHPMKIGIGLHCGEVFFGNVGGEERLDFTVIGRTVNETSRVEALCKPLGKSLLLTEPVRKALSSDIRSGFDAMGAHSLRGVGAPMAIFSQ